MTDNTDRLPNPHAGDILLHEFLKPLGMSQLALSRAIGIPCRRLNKIVKGTRSLRADEDLRLSRYFRVSDGFFLRLQNSYDLMERRRQIADQLDRITPRAA